MSGWINRVQGWETHRAVKHRRGSGRGKIQPALSPLPAMLSQFFLWHLVGLNHKLSIRFRSETSWFFSPHTDALVFFYFSWTLNKNAYEKCQWTAAAKKKKISQVKQYRMHSVKIKDNDCVQSNRHPAPFQVSVFYPPHILHCFSPQTAYYFFLSYLCIL